MKKKKFVMPFGETNDMPSLATFQNPDEGVRSQLTPVTPSTMQSNGLTIDDVRTMSGMRNHCQLDQIAIASAEMDKHATEYAKSGLHTYFSKSLTRQTPKIPRS